MKIYNRENFLKLPDGIIYSSGKKWYFGNMFIKNETLNKDYVSTCFMDIEHEDSEDFFYKMIDMFNNGASYPINNDPQRDGGFEEDEIYLIYEKDDLLTLINHFKNAIKELDEAQI